MEVVSRGGRVEGKERYTVVSVRRRKLAGGRWKRTLGGRRGLMVREKRKGQAKGRRGRLCS